MKAFPAHILIVEDDPVTRAKLAAYFKAEGYRISEAATIAVLATVLLMTFAVFATRKLALSGDER